MVWNHKLLGVFLHLHLLILYKNGQAHASRLNLWGKDRVDVHDDIEDVEGLLSEAEDPDSKLSQIEQVCNE